MVYQGITQTYFCQIFRTVNTVVKYGQYISNTTISKDCFILPGPDCVVVGMGAACVVVGHGALVVTGAWVVIGALVVTGAWVVVVYIASKL